MKTLLQAFFITAIAFHMLPAARAGVALEQPDGARLELAEPAARVVTLSPHLTELFYAAGAGETLIATVEYSEFPDAARNLPRVGDAFRLDIERIVAMNPDLVVAWASGNPEPAVEQIRSLGVPVWSVEIREPEEIAHAVLGIGNATGDTRTAEATARAIRMRLADLERRYGDAPPLSYFYQVGRRPLFTINGSHLISKGLALCGGRNIFEEEPGLAFQVGRESVILANPDALIAPFLEDQPDPLASWKEWPALTAVRRNALILLPADSISRATPRFLNAVEYACRILAELREKPNDA